MATEVIVMKFRLLALALGGLWFMGLWAYSNVEIRFDAARVATTLVADQRGTAREAIKAGLERFDGPLDIAVNDFTDAPLQLVLIRLSSARSIRLLLGRGGIDPEAETTLCQQLNQLFEVRFVENLGHHFAVVGGSSVVSSSLDWTREAFNNSTQAVIEIKSDAVASAYAAQFESLWKNGSRSCDDRLAFP